MDNVYINLYQADDLLSRFHYGDHVKNSLKQHKGKYVHFDLILAPHTQYTIFISLESSGLISTKLEMTDNEGFMKKNFKEIAIFTLYAGLMILLVYYNTLHYIALKNRLFNIYSLYILAMLGSQLGTHGYLYLLSSWIPPVILSELAYMVSVLMIIFSIYFVMEFFDLKNNHILLYHLHRLLIVLNALFFVVMIYGLCCHIELYLYGIKELSINTYYILNILFAILMIMIDTIVLRKLKIPGAYFVALGYISMALIMGIFIIIDLLNPIKEDRLIPVSIIASTVEFLLITYALSLQIKTIRITNQKLDKLLLFQSKQATFGTMIDTIAHQWKQPLNEMSLQVLGLKSKILYEEKIPSKSELLKFTDHADAILGFMGKTVDTFRNFFKTSKELSAINISQKSEDILLFFEETFKSHGIQLVSNIEKNIYYTCKEEEFAHAILNILVNAKDVFILREIENPQLTYTLKNAEKMITLEVQDNAGGIHQSPIESVFDTNMSTKKSGGVGLYITHKIIKDKMHGVITVRNSENGALFTISLPSDSNVT
jgi:signal transduction histidine kinase